ncbi:unnamed protein product, partial [Prorocentrum cordatum]
MPSGWKARQNCDCQAGVKEVQCPVAHSVLCSAHLGSVQTIWIVNYEAWELSVRPRSPSMVGALMDIVVNVLEL